MDSHWALHALLAWARPSGGHCCFVLLSLAQEGIRWSPFFLFHFSKCTQTHFLCTGPAHRLSAPIAGWDVVSLVPLAGRLRRRGRLAALAEGLLATWHACCVPWPLSSPRWSVLSRPPSLSESLELQVCLDSASTSIHRLCPCLCLPTN